MLTDAEKKKIYDQYGEEGLESGGPGAGGSSFDLFDLLNGGGARRQGPPGRRKAKSALQVLELSLAEVYAGTKKKMKVTRDRVCTECKGKGGKEESITECSKCKGAGRVAKVVQMGFMVSQTISACDECRGRGKVIKDKCPKCKGKAIVEDVKVLEITVDKGTPEGHRFVFSGEADEYVPTIPPYLHSQESRRVM